MTNVAILRTLYDDLRSWAQPLGGEISASGTFVESMDLLATKPRGFLAIIEWQGEEAASDDEFTGVVRSDLGIYVAINPGLALKPGTALWLSEGGRTLLERTNAVRDRVREIVLEDDESTSRYFNYRGARQVLLPDGTPIRAYRLDFQIHHTVADPAYRNINP